MLVASDPAHKAGARPILPPDQMFGTMTASAN